MVSIIIAILSSTVLSAFINGAFSVYKDSQKSKSGVEEGLCFLLLSEIKMSGKVHIQNGFIDMEDLQEFTDLFKAYKSLGGNGYADAIKSSVERLPIREED